MCDFSYNFDTSRPGGSAVKVADLLSIQYCDLRIRRTLARRAGQTTSSWKAADMGITNQPMEMQ